MRTRSHVDCRTNRRIDSNRFRRDRHAIPACAFAWSRPIYRGLSASLASSARQYFTTINYYSRIDLTPNADTQITATLLPSPRSPTVLLSPLEPPSSLFLSFSLSLYVHCLCHPPLGIPHFRTSRSLFSHHIIYSRCASALGLILSRAQDSWFTFSAREY